MRVVGKEGHPALGAVAADDPIIAPLLAPGYANQGPHLLANVEQGACALTVQRRAAHAGNTVGENHHAILGVGGQNLRGALRAQRRAGLRAQQLHLVVAAQVVLHHLHPHERIVDCPRLGLEAEQKELGGQCVSLVQPGVDAVGVGLQRRLAPLGEMRPRLFGDAPVAHRALVLVDAQRRRTQHLGEAAIANAAIHFKLPHAVLRMNVTQRKDGVVVGGGEDVGYGVGVAYDLHGAVEAGHGERACGGRQAGAQVEPSTHRHHDEKQQNNAKHGQEAAHGDSGLVIDVR